MRNQLLHWCSSGAEEQQVLLHHQILILKAGGRHFEPASWEGIALIAVYLSSKKIKLKMRGNKSSSSLNKMKLEIFRFRNPMTLP
jgi:hypothetical protein